MINRSHQVNQFLVDDTYNLLAWFERLQHLFADGWSIAIKFSAVQTILKGTVKQPPPKK